MHILSPRWIEESNQTIRTRISVAARSADIKMKGWLSGPDYQEYLSVLELHKDPWTGPNILPILSGKPDSKSIGNLISFEMTSVAR
jgi:hypothetical protein